MSTSEKKIFCNLVFDEMAIRQHEEWVLSQNKCLGYVDMGTGAEEKVAAKDALVFLLVAINENCKIPIGYFLIVGITGEQKKGKFYFTGSLDLTSSLRTIYDSELVPIIEYEILVWDKCIQNT